MGFCEAVRSPHSKHASFGLSNQVVQFKPCPIQVSYKAVEVDKDKMYDILQKKRGQAIANDSTAAPDRPTDETALPPLKYSSDDDGWTTLDEPLLYLFAGKGPYVGR